MALVLVFMLGVPLGRLLPSRKLAWAVFAAAFLVVLPVQTAAVSDAGNLDWSYWPVQVAIAALGLLLVAVGARWRQRSAQRPNPERETS